MSNKNWQRPPTQKRRRVLVLSIMTSMLALVACEEKPERHVLVKMLGHSQNSERAAAVLRNLNDSTPKEVELDYERWIVWHEDGFKITLDAEGEAIRQVTLLGPTGADDYGARVYTGDIPFGLGFHMSPRQVEETLGIAPSDTGSFFGPGVVDYFDDQDAIDRFGAEILVEYAPEAGIGAISLVEPDE